MKYKVISIKTGFELLIERTIHKERMGRIYALLDELEKKGQDYKN